VSVHVDYIQPKTAATLDERICGTVKCGDTNLAESLVSQGLATVIRYRNASDARSSSYTDLLAAEEKAQASGLGMHSKSAPPVHRVADLTGNLSKSRQFLSFLKRTPCFDAVVEFVVHASRVRVFLPRETCLITLLLAGIQCPRKGRPKPDGTMEPDMPFSTEAHIFVKELCMQRNVEVTVESMDRVGNFVGWLFVDSPSSESGLTDTPKSTGKKKKKIVDVTTPKTKANLSVLLVSQGLATVHRAPSTEASPYFHDLVKAEETAKNAKSGLWSSDEFVKLWEAEMNVYNDAGFANGVDEEVLSSGVAIRGYMDDLSQLNLNGHVGDSADTQEVAKIQWKPAQVTAISKPGTGSEGLRFFAQSVSDSATIVQISHSLNSQPPPPAPNYQPKKGELCAACFSLDNCWYRARVLRRNPKSITVQFIDFGNEETIELTDCAVRVSPLPSGALMNIPPQAHEYRLAFIQLPPDTTDRAFAERAFANAVENKEVLLAVQFDSVPCANETVKPVPGVAVRIPTTTSIGSFTSAWIDVAQMLLDEGLVCVEPMRPELLKPSTRVLLPGYLEAQVKAKKERKNVWRYGDFRIDMNQ
ncbi:staphylococcal nuclease domain-containing protein 1, partial [Paragonimus westermani]